MNRGTMQVFLLLFSSFIFAINNCQPLPEPDTLIIGYGNDRLTPLSLIFHRTTNHIFTIRNSGEIQAKNFHFYPFQKPPPKNSVSSHKNIRHRSNKKLTKGSNSNTRLDSPLFDGMEDSNYANLNFDSMHKRRANRSNKRNGNENRNRNGNGSLNRELSRAKQKKAKELRRLLMLNASNKRVEEDQDYYDFDQDDDYYKRANKQKMKWEDYQNEDGASVMELIALNDRHKNYYNQYLN